MNYPSPPNSVGDSKTNTATVGVTLVGGGTKTLTPSVTHTLTAPTGTVVTSTFAKAFIESPLQVGEEASIRLRTRNTGNVLTDFVVEDVIPNELNVVRITTSANTTAAEYQKNGVNTWIPGVTLGTNVAVNTTNFPGFSPGDYVSALRFQMTNVPVNADRDNLIYATVINPPHGGGPVYTLPRTVPNTATSTQSYLGAPQPTQTSTANLSVIEPRTVVYVAPTKSVVSGSPAVPGGIIRLRLQAAANSGSDNVAMLNPVLTDLLPANLEYAANAVVAKSATASAECLPGPSVQQIANYNSTGRTLLIWSWAGRSPACTIPPGQNVSVDFNHARPAGHGCIHHRLCERRRCDRHR